MKGFSALEHWLRLSNLPRTTSTYANVERVGSTACLSRPLEAVSWPLSKLWEFVSVARNFAYDKRILFQHEAECPVISIGNVTVGGTGKTPMVEWTSKVILGYKPDADVVILTRGYGNDEDKQLSARLPELHVLPNANRVAAYKEAVQTIRSPIFILDDGLQHRKLSRHLDIMMVDAIYGFGRAKTTIPRGILREPYTAALSRVDAIVIHNSNLVSHAELNHLQTFISKHTKATTCLSESRVEGFSIVNPDGSSMRSSLRELQGRTLGVCGIGCPEAFATTLEKSCQGEVHTLAFGDHYEFDDHDVESMKVVVDKGVHNIVITEKDYYRCPNTWTTLCRLLARTTTEAVQVHVLHVSTKLAANSKPLVALIREAVSASP